MTLPKTMRALQLQALGGLKEVTLPLPVPRPDEVLIRTGATTICTSDLNDIQHNPFGIALPRVLGHEGAGIVVTVGTEVKGFHAGARVAGHPVIPCRKCSNCARGLGHLCEQMGHLGLDRDGTFAEYYCLRADRVRPIPPELDFTAAALLEPVAVCIEALERARLQPGESVLIVGDGPFGIIIARLAFTYRPKTVILAGRHEFRLQQVAGAAVINQQRTADVPDAVRLANDGAGVDVGVLATGSQLALDLALASLRARGRVVVFSALQGRAQVDLFRLHVNELSLVGACNDENYIDLALRWLSDPSLALSSMVTHRVPLDEWPRAFELAAKGKEHALKVALTFRPNS